MVKGRRHIAFGMFYRNRFVEGLLHGCSVRLRESPELSNWAIVSYNSHGRLWRDHQQVPFAGAVVYGNQGGLWKGPGSAPHLQEMGVPVINMANRFDWCPVPGVYPDNEKIGELAADFLMRAGFEHFIYAGQQGFQYSKERGKAYAKHLAENGKSCFFASHSLTGTTRCDHMSFRDRHIALAQSLEGVKRPCAVFCSNDDMALGLLHTLLDIGFKVPDDAVILGVDDDPTACLSGSVPLSSIDPNPERIGWTAMDSLLRMIDGTPVPDDQRIPPLDIIERQSTDPFSHEDDPVINKALEILREHYREDLSIAELAVRVGTSRRNLDRRFNDVLGVSPSRELLRLRLIEAKRMLLLKDKPIGEIAEATGFSSARRFSETFRNEEKVSPSEFRKKALTG